MRPLNVKFVRQAVGPGDAARGGGERRVGVESEPSTSANSPPGTDSSTVTGLLVMALSEATWEPFSRGSAIRRAGQTGFARDVCVSLGNQGAQEAVPVLVDPLSDREPLVRGHAAWALGEVGSAEARAARGLLGPGPPGSTAPGPLRRPRIPFLPLRARPAPG